MSMIDETPLLDQFLENNVGFEFFEGDREKSRELLRPIIEDVQSLSIPIITVAGTNGKGETCLKLESLLMLEGHSPCLWTSPHLISVTERFRFKGKPIGPSWALSSFEKYKHLGKDLSYYEFLFYHFCLWVLEVRPDVIILEVGLGGRLDAVNYFNPSLTAITSISKDHTAILGPDLKSILKEKLGITRSGVPLVSFVQKEDLQELISKEATDKNFPLICAPQCFDMSFKERNSLQAKMIMNEFGELERKSFDSSQWDSVLSDCSFIGRGEWVTSSKGNFMLIGSHNSEGLDELFHHLGRNESLSFDRMIVGFSDRPDEELSEMLSTLMKFKSMTSKLLLTGLEHQRAMAIEKIRRSVSEITPKEKEGLSIDFNESFSIKNLNDSKERTLITGSYYFVGHVLRLLKSHSRPRVI